MSSAVTGLHAGPMLVRHAVHAVLCGAPLLLLAAGASAGTPADEDKLDEVQVTAQFREQDPQDVPLAITVLTPALLTQRSQTSIAEAVLQAPNVMLKQQGPQFGPSVAAFIRGVGANDFNPAREPGVGLYVDDVYYATLTGANLDLMDIERVEILRGPQGTLAGRNSLGGAIKLYSQQPQPEDSGSFGVTYGSRNRLDLRGMANFALADNLFVRITGVDKSQDGYVDRIDYGCAFPNNPYGIRSLRASTAGCVVAKDSDVDYSAGRMALRWLATDRVVVDLAADYSTDRRNPTGAVLVDFRDASQAPDDIARIQPIYDANPLNDVRPSAFVVPAGSYYNYATFYSPAYMPPTTGPAPAGTLPMVETRPKARQFVTSWGTSLNIAARLTDALSLNSISAYRGYHSGFANDDDLSPLNSSMGDGLLPFRSFSQELRLSGEGERLHWTVGGYYLDQRTRYQSWLDLRFSGLLQFQQDDVVNVDSKAAFADIAYELTSQLELNLGVRDTDEHKDYTFVRLNREGTAPAAGVGALNGWRSVYDGTDQDYRVGLKYRWNADTMAYLQYATGFKGGGVSPRPFFAAQALSFGSEHLKTWEAGSKTELFEHRLRLNTAVFYSDYKDVQIGLSICPTVPSTPCGAIANAGDATIKGFELEAVLQPLRGLTVDASYGYTDFSYDRLAPTVATIQKFYTAPFVPESSGSLGGQYEFNLAGGGTLTLRGDATFQSSLFTMSTNAESNRIGSYALFNARLSWKDAHDKLEVSLEGTNLADRYYFLARGDQFVASGKTDGAPGRPREWAVTVKKNF